VASGQRPCFDELDRRILACLQADGRASWTAIAQRSGTSVATAARRGQRLLAQQAARVAVVPTRIHHGRSTMFLMRLACRAGAQAAVAAHLAARPQIRFLALVSGRYDIVAEVCASSSESLFRQLVSEYQGIEGVDWCEVDLILREHKVAQDWSWQLLVGESAATAVREPHICEADHLDDYDRQIVAALSADGRLPFSVVAARVALDETTVRRRFEAFSSRGCVRTLTLVPAAALGFTSELILDVSVEPARLHDVATRLTTYPGVRFVADTLNGSSLLCELIQPGEPALHSFLTDSLSRLTGVRGWEASMELLTLKRGFLETPWWREQLPPAAVPIGAGARSARSSRRRRTALGM
jgi:DNA-binding Lrp family transcriptional regulator